MCCGKRMSENEDTPIHNPNICAACFNLPNEMEESASSHKYAEFVPNQIGPVAFGDASSYADLSVGNNGKNRNGFANHKDPVSTSER
jgi:hypothetical protein